MKRYNIICWPIHHTETLQFNLPFVQQHETLQSNLLTSTPQWNVTIQFDDRFTRILRFNTFFDTYSTMKRYNSIYWPLLTNEMLQFNLLTITPQWDNTILTCTPQWISTICWPLLNIEALQYNLLTVTPEWEATIQLADRYSNNKTIQTNFLTFTPQWNTTIQFVTRKTTIKR